MRLTNHAISIIFKYVGKKKNPDKTQSVWGVKHWKLAASSIQVLQCQPLFSFVFIVVIYIFIHSCICLFVRCSLDSIVFSLGWDESFFYFLFFHKKVLFSVCKAMHYCNMYGIGSHEFLRPRKDSCDSIVVAAGGLCLFLLRCLQKNVRKSFGHYFYKSNIIPWPVV